MLGVFCSLFRRWSSPVADLANTGEFQAPFAQTIAARRPRFLFPRNQSARAGPLGSLISSKSAQHSIDFAGPLFIYFFIGFTAPGQTKPLPADLPDLDIDSHEWTGEEGGGRTGYTLNAFKTPEYYRFMRYLKAIGFQWIIRGRRINISQQRLTPSSLGIMCVNPPTNKTIVIGNGSFEK